MRFEWVVALRFLREGRFQTALIIVGASVGVAVVIFITTLVTGLQANTIKRVLARRRTSSSRRGRKSRDRSTRAAGRGNAAAADRGAHAAAALDRPVAGARRAARTHARHHRGVADRLRRRVRAARRREQGDQPHRHRSARHDRIIHLADKMVAGRFVVQPGDVVIGRDLAADLGAAVGDRIRLQTAQRGQRQRRVHDHRPVRSRQPGREPGPRSTSASAPGRACSTCPAARRNRPHGRRPVRRRGIRATARRAGPGSRSTAG